jgi:hypothetical protein
MSEIQVSAIRKHPALVSFVNSLYIETDPEIADEIDICSEFSQVNNLLLSEIDLSKFKIGVTPQLICKFMFWAERGFMEELYSTAQTEVQTDELATSFYSCLAFMQNTLYESKE